MMLQYSTYSVISPEGCASILWKSADKAPEAAETLGITASRLKTLGLIDKVSRAAGRCPPRLRGHDAVDPQGAVRRPARSARSRSTNCSTPGSSACSDSASTRKSLRAEPGGRPLAPAADRLSERIRTRCEVHLTAGTEVTVGLSGGLDSVVLLHLLQPLGPALGLRIRALHVHHGLNPRADDWAAFCAGLCARLDVPLVVKRVEVADRAALGVEAAARRARYRCYRDSGADVVALAHHADDQGETVLLQMLRGAGPAGLSAMPEMRAVAGWPRIFRPSAGGASFRPWRRAPPQPAWRGSTTIRTPTRGTPGTISATRSCRASRRAFPGWRGTLARVAANAADAMTLADALGADDLAKVQGPDGIDLDGLARLDAVRAANVLRVWLHGAGVSAPPRDRLLDWLRQFATAGRHRRVVVPDAALALVAHRGRLRLESMPAVPPGWLIPWRGEPVLTLPDGRSLRFEQRLGEGVRVAGFDGRRVEVSTRRGGQRLQLAANRPHRPLKDLLREAGLPPWARDHVPLLIVDDRLAWVSGLGPDASFAAGPGEAGVRPDARVRWMAEHLTRRGPPPTIRRFHDPR
jgi:tRNA(Ile)-lysidine synthase